MADREVDPLEASRRRRIISSALSGLLSPAQVNLALLLWETEFAGSPVFAVAAYIGRLNRALDLGVRGAEVGRLLRSKMFLEIGDLGPDPLHSSSQAAAAPASPPQGKSPSMAAVTSRSNPGWDDATVVFNHLLSTIVERLHSAGNGNTENLCKHLQAQGPGLGLTRPAATALSRWTATPGSMEAAPLGDGFSVPDMQQLVHAVYVWVCELLGPAKADRFLADSARQCNDLPEAARFPARRFF